MVLTTGHWEVALVTALAVTGCVLLHYEVLDLLDRLMVRIHAHRRRPRLLILMFCLILLHIVEIWIFGISYWWLGTDLDRGMIEVLQGASAGMLDYVYFSAVIYTTLGLGDMIPHGPMRFMVGTEALTGFLLVTWSASFTFMEMERWWRRRN
ncbi:MAG: ion channel [Gammaproteobacteria bacterium]